MAVVYRDKPDDLYSVYKDKVFNAKCFFCEGSLRKPDNKIAIFWDSPMMFAVFHPDCAESLAKGLLLDVKRLKRGGEINGKDQNRVG